MRKIITKHKGIQLINQQVLISRKTFIKPCIQQKFAICPDALKPTIRKPFNLEITISQILGNVH